MKRLGLSQTKMAEILDCDRGTIAARCKVEIVDPQFHYIMLGMLAEKSAKDLILAVGSFGNNETYRWLGQQVNQETENTELAMVTQYKMGCFVNCNGNVHDVANPGFGMSCKVEGRTVLLLGEHDPDDGAEVLEECTFYPSLKALAAIGFRPDENGKAVSI